MKPWLRMTCVALLGFGVLVAPRAPGQTGIPRDVLMALQKGGQVIVMRHARSPQAVPDKATANADNTTLERQLDEEGRATATAMGNALRAMKIPIGAVLSSPTYRARETVRWAQLPTPQLRNELGDGGQSMQGVGAAQGDWLRAQVAQFRRGTNTFIVTHLPNISAAFPEDAQGIADGEALVFGPDGKGGATLLARIRIEDWPTLAR